MGDEVMTAEAGVVEVAGLLRRVEGPPQQRAAGPDLPRPAPEAQVDAGLEAVQPAFLHQIDAHLAEPEPRPVIAEARSHDHVETDIGEARSVGIAMPDADVRHPKQGEAEQIRVGEECRRCHLRQNIHGRAQVRFGHQRQLE